MTQYNITVKGRVQGVGFRHFTRKQATILGLKGRVKNTASGGVQVLVQGEVEEINTFIDYLRVGTTRSQISTLSTESENITEIYPDFSIRF